MKVLLFSDSEIWEILKLLAAVMHMGNVKYKATVIGKLIVYQLQLIFGIFFNFSLFICSLDNLDATEIPEQTNVKRVAQLLGVQVQSLIDALTRRTIFASGETVVRILCIFISAYYYCN
jgi:myosin-7